MRLMEPWYAPIRMGIACQAKSISTVEALTVQGGPYVAVSPLDMGRLIVRDSIHKQRADQSNAGLTQCAARCVKSFV